VPQILGRACYFNGRQPQFAETLNSRYGINQNGCGRETEGSSMSEAKNEHHATEANRLLAGAAKVVANARSCWLATAVAPGDAKLRPMGRLPNEPGEDEWMIRFITDGRSRKAADMRRDNRVTIIFQNEPDNAFVSVIGAAVLHEKAYEDHKHWKEAYDAFFPSEQDRANATFVEVEIERMELWILGVTAEPFGMTTTVLERDGRGGWRASFR
jgi:general stress protein 26